MRIAICDDNRSHLAQVKTSTLHYASAYLNDAVQISEYDNSLVFLEELHNNGGFDIVLLDICMPGILGTEAAREIRQRKDKTEIIFLTVSHEFAVDAFALDAAHYITKPFSQAEFDEAMNRALRAISQKQIKNVLIKTTSGVRAVDINTIIYVESFRHYLTIHLEDSEEIKTRVGLLELGY